MSSPVLSPCSDAPLPHAMERKLSLRGVPRLTSLQVYSALMIEEEKATVDDSLKWCNALHTAKCPFCAGHEHGAADAKPCKFQHLDTYVQIPAGERPAMLSVMTRHVKSLIKDMVGIMHAHARRSLQTWFVRQAWALGNEGGEVVFGDLNPFGGIVEKLRSLGWVIPERAARCTSPRVEEAPYAGDVASIASVVANMLHFQIKETPEFMYQTIAYVFGLDAPASKKDMAPALDHVEVVGDMHFSDGGNTFPDLAAVIDGSQSLPDLLATMNANVEGSMPDLLATMTLAAPEVCVMQAEDEGFASEGCSSPWGMSPMSSCLHSPCASVATSPAATPPSLPSPSARRRKQAAWKASPKQGSPKATPKAHKKYSHPDLSVLRLR
eukprot:TRINITY_DN146_c0_g1_i2.p1 TRINITY_DN146_c0_g1~~TRINITY_DN146_c0_g1_i2.p1  ORF type:complete len:381 (+),score=150.98 TRINITY_DN146_c0_g1_i2:61-1203(+)